jgi:hypothetical protein
MSYQEAKKIRSKSFGDIMARKLSEGQGIGSSFGATLSEKSAAKMKGIKEKFDLMNMAKFMTGGSNLAPAIVGRLTGRSAADIKYFSGVKDKKNDTVTKLEDGSGGFAANNQMIESLLEIYNLLKDTEEEKKKAKEEASQFAEESALEKEANKERRHKELMEAITGKPYQTATKIEPDSESILTSFLDGLGFGKDSLKTLKSVFGLLLGPVGGLMLMAGFFTALHWLVQYAADNMTNYRALTPSQAAEMLARGDKKEMDFYGGREKLIATVMDVPTQAKELLDEYESIKDKKDDQSTARKSLLEVEMKKLGGIDQVRQIVKEGEVKLPEGFEQIETLKDKVKPRPTGAGLRGDLNRKHWDEEFGQHYNEDGTLKEEFKKVPVQTQSNNNTEQVNQVVAGLEPKNSAEPVVATNNKLNNVQTENLQAKLEEKTLPGKTVVNNSVVKSAMESAFIDGPLLPVRNMEETFQDMILYSTRIV